MKDFFGNKKPVQIETGEWWFNGCIIQKRIHPMLLLYVSFKDLDGESFFVQTYYSFNDAIRGVLENGCKTPSRFPCNYGV